MHQRVVDQGKQGGCVGMEEYQTLRDCPTGFHAYVESILRNSSQKVAL